MKQITIILFLLATAIVHPQANRILLDEDFSDWSQDDLVYTDTQGDYETGEHDFYNLYVDNDDQYLFIRFEIADKVVLAEDNNITLYIDTDNNSATGRTLYGVGSEVEFTFGAKSGGVRLPGKIESIEQSDIGIIYLPTVSSNKFEVAINRQVSLFGQNLFKSNNIKILLISNNTVGDRMPNEDGGVAYTIKNESLEPLPAYSIGKVSNEYLRVMAYNPERIFKNNQQIDGLFDPEREEYHKKIFQAIQPDIIGLVEMYSHNSQETADKVSGFISSDPADNWYNAKLSRDLVLLSKFPVKQNYKIDVLDETYFTSHAALLDLRPKYETDMLVILAHPKCCSGNDDRRQSHMDAIMQFIREAKNGTGPMSIQNQTPIVIMGDMNFVGLSGPRETILTGDIFDNQHYGADFKPDWDDSDFEDAKPYVTSVPMAFTSYNENSPYSPGRLDYIFYSGSVMEIKNSYVLFSRDLPADISNTYNLAYNTTTLASDHLPVVADFYFPNVVSVDDKEDAVPVGFHLKQNYPNPFNPETVIGYNVPAHKSKESVKVKLRIYDILGNEVETLVNEEQAPGNYEVKFDTRDLPALASGIYFYAIVVGNRFDVKKMTLLK